MGFGGFLKKAVMAPVKATMGAAKMGHKATMGAAKLGARATMGGMKKSVSSTKSMTSRAFGRGRR